ncbi:MAG: glycosyltransferase [Parvibaculum sp.]
MALECSNTSAPRVSIIVPSYNHAAYVRDALMSVAAQTYPNIELIVIDDGSRDETPQIVEETLAGFQRDIRIEFRKQENMGLCATLNRALDLVEGEFVQFLASDDAYLPEKTAACVAALRASPPDVAAVYCDGYIIDEKSQRRGVFSQRHPIPLGKNLHRELLLSNWIPALGMLYRRDDLTAVGGFDADLKFEDWDLLLRLTQERRIERITDKLFLYRLHSTNMSRDNKMMEESVSAMVEKHQDLAAFFQFKNDLKQRRVGALMRNLRNFDLVFRMVSRRLFTDRGIQGEELPAATLSLVRLMASRVAVTVRAAAHRLIGFRLGRHCKIGGRLKFSGNLSNLEVGSDVIFEGDAEFILPRGRGQGRITIGDGCVIAHGALFHCIAGELVVGHSSYVGRNAVLQSNGDLRIGAWNLIAAGVGLYASNHVSSCREQPIWTQGNRFIGITIGENCWIGYGGVVVDGTDLGANSIVGPNVVLRRTHGPDSRIIS